MSKASETLKNLAKEVAKYAPLLGAALPIPGGAAIGAIISSVFGTDDNDELIKIIQTDPNAAIKLREIESNQKVALENIAMLNAQNILTADTARLSEINQTMRAESLSGDSWQRRWRPFWGFISAIAFFVQVLVISWAIIDDPATASTIIMSMTNMQTFWAVPLAILGIASWHRGKEKRIIAGEENTDIVDTINKLKK